MRPTTWGGSDFRPEFDERREVWRLLHHLTPELRIRFLRWCCRQVSTDAVKTDVTQSDGSVNGVLGDIYLLCFDRGLSLGTIGEKLVEVVKRYGTDPGLQRKAVGFRVT